MRSDCRRRRKCSGFLWRRLWWLSGKRMRILWRWKIQVPQPTPTHHLVGAQQDLWLGLASLAQLNADLLNAGKRKKGGNQNSENFKVTEKMTREVLFLGKCHRSLGVVYPVDKSQAVAHIDSIQIPVGWQRRFKCLFSLFFRCAAANSNVTQEQGGHARGPYPL